MSETKEVKLLKKINFQLWDWVHFYISKTEGATEISFHKSEQRAEESVSQSVS